MKDKYSILTFCIAVLLILALYTLSAFLRTKKDSNKSTLGNWDNSMTKGRCYGHLEEVVGNYSFNGFGTENSVESSYAFNGGGIIDTDTDRSNWNIPIKSNFYTECKSGSIGGSDSSCNLIIKPNGEIIKEMIR
ncbi:MAG: hypothetical protein PHX21_13170 [bacterium]|nr:hypothetical protein [bacterium]